MPRVCGGVQLASPTQYYMSEASCFHQLARFLLTPEHNISQMFQTIEALYMLRVVSVYLGVSFWFPWSPAFPGGSCSCVSVFHLCRWGWRKTASISAQKLTPLYLKVPGCPVPTRPKSVLLSLPNMLPLVQFLVLLHHNYHCAAVVSHNVNI